MARRSKIRGGVYWRDDCSCWWFRYYDAAGVRQAMSAETTDEKQAIARWHATDREARAEEALAVRTGQPLGPVTCERYLDAWEKMRAERPVAPEKKLAQAKAAKKDAQRVRDHALPFIGRLPLVEVTREHLLTMVRELWAGAPSGPKDDVISARTIRHVYEAVRAMFDDAVRERLIVGTPCTLSGRGRNPELPSRKPDKKTMRRAIFTPDEVEILISDQETPFRRRVHYAMGFLSGMRQGEMADRRFEDYDTRTEFLGRLLVHSSWDFELLLSKSTKTGAEREVPVHRTLALLLADWLAHGWEADQGRKPTPSDLILPAPKGSRTRSERGNHLSTQEALELLHADLKRLGMRERRFHDMRRTFITLARRKSPKDHVRWITHAPEDDIIEGYTSPEWETMCEVVKKIDVSVRGGDVYQLFTGGTPLVRSP
jgi:integrase